jgi:trehalose synthase-fused probable maltokinase
VTDLEQRIRDAELEFLDEKQLVEFVLSQRWFGAKESEISHGRVLAAHAVRQSPPYLVDVLVEMRFPAGTHEVYQLPLGFRPREDGWTHGVVAEVAGWTAYDALADPALAQDLARLIMEGGDGADPALRFHPLAGTPGPPPRGAGRPIGAEQSNTSVVLDERLVLKVYRKLEAGTNPELELLHFLTQAHFRHVPALRGWVTHAGEPMEATLAILQDFVRGKGDGWQLALAALEEGDAEEFLGLMGRLGEVVGDLHATLASDPSDPAFAPEEPSIEALALLEATVEDEIQATFSQLPEREELAPILGRGSEVMERVRLLGRAGSLGRLIRTHGDLHLGQALWTGSDWMLLDFEGEPARPLRERRHKVSPLRDAAGILRSIAYAVSAARLRGAEPPQDWEPRARTAFLDGYLPPVEAAGLLPSSRDGTDRLLSIFELEKAVYELRYELANRPDWLAIPVSGIVRLLEEEPVEAA